MRSVRNWAALLLSLFTLVGCDHATKAVAEASLQSHAPTPLLGSLLDLRYVQNTDVAFNLLRWIPETVRAPLLIAVGITAILGLSTLIISPLLSGLQRTAFVLILAGALGNCLDRLFRGYVVDFIHISHWPVFNVADMLVTGGVAVLFWCNLRQQDRPTSLRLR